MKHLACPTALACVLASAAHAQPYQAPRFQTSPSAAMYTSPATAQSMEQPSARELMAAVQALQIQVNALTAGMETAVQQLKLMRQSLDQIQSNSNPQVQINALSLAGQTKQELDQLSQQLSDVQKRQAITCRLVAEDAHENSGGGGAPLATFCNGTAWTPTTVKTFLGQAIPFKY